MHLAGSRSLPEEKRRHYQHELLSAADNALGKSTFDVRVHVSSMCLRYRMLMAAVLLCAL